MDIKGLDLESTGMALISKILTVGIDGRGPFKGARAVADEHARQHNDLETAIDRVVATHLRMVGATGFVSGLGGLITLPVTVPADMAALYVYQGRMAAAIAHLRGYDVDSDEVQSIVLLSLLGSGGAALLSQVGVDIANKSAASALSKVPGKLFIEINKKVGYRLITKGGTKGVINMTRVVPIAGGVVGGSINLVSSRTVARYARSNFPTPIGTSDTTV